jgi:hypothetical protein
MLGPPTLPTCLAIQHNVHVKGLQAYRGEWGGGCGSSGDACVDAGGHAAHFANIDQASPMFSQERAPTSVAYAENQSMFLDSFIDDAAWKGRYALSRYLLQPEAVPFHANWEYVRCQAGVHPGDSMQSCVFMLIAYCSTNSAYRLNSSC